LLANNIGKNPFEFMDRLLNQGEMYYHTHFHRKPAYPDIKSIENVIADLVKIKTSDVAAILAEEAIKNITAHITKKFEQPQINAVAAGFNADLDLARLCYVACRLLQPRVVIETGVANGVTSSFILQALEKNGKGELHSIDLQPLSVYDGSEVGSFVPENLRQRWHLQFGSSKRLLPKLARQLEHIDIFIHDSLHSYHNVRRELKSVTPYLAGSYAVLVDNIVGNSAFTEWTSRTSPRYSAIVKEKNSLFGFAYN
jgi:predicted O-methyltransferase YrrM